jgi:hypothetical protein
MSVKSEFKDFKDIMSPVIGPILRGTAWLFSGEVLETVSEIYCKRQQLPEPFDYPAHIGNFREAAMGTVVAFGILGLKTMVEPLSIGARDIFRRNAQRTAVAAFALSSIVQVVGEKYELSNYAVPGAHNTGDPLDAAYGIGWSAVVAVGACKFIQGLEEDHIAKSQETFANFAETRPAIYQYAARNPVEEVSL